MEQYSNNTGLYNNSNIGTVFKYNTDLHNNNNNNGAVLK